MKGTGEPHTLWKISLVSSREAAVRGCWWESSKLGHTWLPAWGREAGDTRQPSNTAICLKGGGAKDPSPPPLTARPTQIQDSPSQIYVFL